MNNYQLILTSENGKVSASFRADAGTLTLCAERFEQIGQVLRQLAAIERMKNGKSTTTKNE